MGVRLLGIVGSYHKGGTIDTVVSEVLSAARERGAETEKVYLVDAHIEFCRNCRSCTRTPGAAPGACVHDDDMDGILAQYDRSDGVVIGAPVNFFNVNAITRRFMERLVRYSFWPWGQMVPKMRATSMSKKAVLVTSSAMPGVLVSILSGAPRALKLMAKAMGAKPIALIAVGLAAGRERSAPPERAMRRARSSGRRLVQALGDRDT